MAATSTGHHISATLTVDSSQAPPSVCQAVVWTSPGSYREVDGGWSGGTLQREGTGDSQKLRSQLPRERSGLATELAPRPGGASAAPALFSVCRGTGGGDPAGPEAGGRHGQDIVGDAARGAGQRGL